MSTLSDTEIYSDNGTDRATSPQGPEEWLESIARDLSTIEKKIEKRSDWGYEYALKELQEELKDLRKELKTIYHQHIESPYRNGGIDSEEYQRLTERKRELHQAITEDEEKLIERGPTWTEKLMGALDQVTKALTSIAALAKAYNETRRALTS